jgi:protein-tyrosine phosphatase
MTTVLFVCTGNLCRSPSAALLLAQHLSEAGPPDVTVESAGTSETTSTVPPKLVHEASGFGLDLYSHVPRRVDTATIARADMVIGMARTHVRETVLADPSSFTKTFTLREIVRRGVEKGQRRPLLPLAEWMDEVGGGRRHAEFLGDSAQDDIADPMGGTSVEYRTMLLELATLTRTLHSLIWS